MHRLLVGQYGDRGGAEAALQRVKAIGGSAFVMREGDQFAVYAGSFHEVGRAAREKDKLAADGVITAMRTMPVSMASYRLTAGHFATREDARKAAAKLAKAGLSPRVVTIGAK
jgi:cell division septation protein DedD